MIEIRGEEVRAVIADLDGVLTRTARLHSRAWKRMFDELLDELRSRGEEVGGEFTDDDYQRLVDGKPRLDGVRSFLRSRDLSLPEGEPGDGPGERSVHGLGARKNELFHRLLESEGVEVFEESVQALRRLRDEGVRTAVVSSSRNCAAVLEAAGLEGLFEVRVDGVVAEEEGLKGKPAPDLFLHAARRLGVSPEAAVVIEDSTAGVEAGRRGDFALVVGVDRDGRRQALREAGADVVVRSLAELEPGDADVSGEGEPPPSALGRFDRIRSRLAAGEVALFLDYDGTLTPIVERPEDAVLSGEMREVLSRLAARVPVAVVSGRDRADVEERVGLDGLYYAGSHGFDISGPNGLREEHPGGVEALPELDRAEEELRRRLEPIPGAQVERKRFSLAIHYRRTPPERVEEVREAVSRVHEGLDGLRRGRGKKVIELQPDVDWDKGRAIRWLADRLDLDRPEVLQLYLGDDWTDEDAFRALSDDGVGIYVGELDRETAADYVLADTGEVRQFLERLSAALENG